MTGDEDGSHIDIYHVLPINDLQEHEDITLHCWCKPIIEELFDRIIVIHHAADGRDVKERGMLN